MKSMKWEMKIPWENKNLISLKTLAASSIQLLCEVFQAVLGFGVLFINVSASVTDHE